MSKVWYGSLTNRIEENKTYCDKVEVNTQLTEYSYSDCYPYEVVKILGKDHYMVRRLDHIPDGECYSNNWKLVSNIKNPECELIKRYNHWNWVYCNLAGEKYYSKTNISFGIGQYYYDYEF